MRRTTRDVGINSDAILTVVRSICKRAVVDTYMVGSPFDYSSFSPSQADFYLLRGAIGPDSQHTVATMGSLPTLEPPTQYTHSHPVPPPGIYTPAVTFFDPATDTLLATQQSQYYSYLASTGLTGLVILGTNAETFLLTREERATLLKLARQSVPADYPIIAGVGGHSTAQVLEYIADAAAAGANYVLVLPAAYFGKQTTPSVVHNFYTAVAKASPLPILIYNFPAVCNGLDLDSDVIAQLAQENPNIVGVKLTCGSVGKITRLAATFQPERFAVFGGQSDFLVGGLAAGSAGCIAAFGNIFPKTVVKVFDLYKMGKHDQALALQRMSAHAENPTKAGIATTKYAVSQYSARAAGIPGDLEAMLRPRRPYEEPGEAVKKKIREVMTPVAEIEKTL